MPRGDWIWPAIWFMPAANKYGGWPASGEIDLVESYGNEATCPNKNNQGFGSTNHWGPKWPYDGWQAGHAGYFNQAGSLANDFHTYELEWTKDYVKTYIDKKLVLNFDTKNRDMFTAGGFPRNVHNPWEGQARNAPFDQDFYFIFNVAVGGTNGYFPDGMCGTKPWYNGQKNPPGAFYDGRAKWWPTWNYPATHNSAMQIDWVKVWAFDDDHVVQESEPTEQSDKPEFLN